MTPKSLSFFTFPMGNPQHHGFRYPYFRLKVYQYTTDSTVSSLLVLNPGFRTIRKDRKKGPGDLLAYIRNGLSAYRRLKLESSDIESIRLDVKGSNNSRFIVCACYRSPTKNKESDFLASLSTATENMYNTRKVLLLLGDFNMDMSLDEKLDLIRFATEVNMMQI